jgi:hypothetical protein
MTQKERLDLIERKIQAICTINDEIIQRILHKMESGDHMIDYDYLILHQGEDEGAEGESDEGESDEGESDEEEEGDREGGEEKVCQQRQPHRFKVEEIQTIRSFQLVVNTWTVPSNLELPENPDPDETLYGKHGALMDMTCEGFSDLVRINKQLAVALKYTSMLRKSLAIKFGLKFQRNFELLQVLLGTLETLLMGTASRLEEKQDEVNRLNEQMVAIFAQDNVWSGGGPHFFAGLSRKATITRRAGLNKGTLLSSGVHQWKVKCVYIAYNYELGVASPNHISSLDSKMNGYSQSRASAWGIQQDGTIFPNGTNCGTMVEEDDIVTFVLNCSFKTLTISINEVSVAIVADIILPVHIAFSGDANACAKIL